MLTKALRPLPDKYHGLVDQEMRYRQRYVDLIVNWCARFSEYVRLPFNSSGSFLPSGSSLRSRRQCFTPSRAAPPETLHYAPQRVGYGDVSAGCPELYLKRLTVGFVEKVFEINRNFRNEGLSTRHNPEFTMLEFYWAYADFRDAMDLTEELMRELTQAVLGTTESPTVAIPSTLIVPLIG